MVSLSECSPPPEPVLVCGAAGGDELGVGSATREMNGDDEGDIWGVVGRELCFIAERNGPGAVEGRESDSGGLEGIVVIVGISGQNDSDDSRRNNRVKTPILCLDRNKN